MKEKLRSGFTTGTCAAAAARGAAVLLVSGQEQKQVSVVTPKGTKAVMTLFDQYRRSGEAGCCVHKDAGDDPDVTNGAAVYARISCIDQEKPQAAWYASDEYPGIWLAGGAGIGLVTRPGLACPVGKAAINPVPRQMIFQAVSQVLQEYGERRTVLITISIPEGAALAEKTFNPRLGIVGGISVLGTSGVVEPMSEEALLATIRLEIHMRAAAGQHSIIIAPGNYGLSFLEDMYRIQPEQVVKCSNFIADTMEMAAREGIREILFAGHIGKLIKVAGGVKNTHSKYGDRRMEILAGFVRQLPGYELLADEILLANTTEEALVSLHEAGIAESVMKKAAEKIREYLRIWGRGSLDVQIVTFSNVYGILAMTSDAERLAQKIRREQMEEHKSGKS